MKKRFTKLLPVLLLAALTLAGCGTRPAPAEMPAHTEAPSMPAPIERLTVSVQTEDESFLDESGENTVLIFHAATPSVSFPSREGAAAEINSVLSGWRDSLRAELNGKTDSYFSVNAAREDLAMRLSDGDTMSFSPYELTQHVLLGRGDSRIVSFIYDTYYYSDGAHGYNVRSGMTFDMQSGAELTTADLSDKPEDFTFFCAQELWKLYNSPEYADRGFFEENTEENVSALVRDGNWWLDDEGLTFVANAYELAPYAAGRIEFTLPYALLEGHIKDAYLPLPKKESIGHICGNIDIEPHVTPLAVIDTGATDYVQSIVLMADGFEADAEVLPQFRLSRIEYYEYFEGANGFNETELLWYAEWLEPDEEIQILTQMPEVIPDLGVRFPGDDGEEKSYALAQSGEDGSLLFTPIEFT